MASGRQVSLIEEEEQPQVDTISWKIPCIDHSGVKLHIISAIRYWGDVVTQ